MSISCSVCLVKSQRSQLPIDQFLEDHWYPAQHRTYGDVSLLISRCRLLTKLLYVYNSVDMSYIGSYSTVQCSKEFNMDKDTLSKYLLNGNPFKGKIFSRVLLHNSEINNASIDP